MARAMKDSGIAWIGEIPEKWGTIRLKYCTEILSGYPFDSAKFSNTSGFPLIRIRDITSGRIETYYDGDYDTAFVVSNGDLLVGMDGDFNVRWWQNVDALLNQRCCKISAYQEVKLKYIYYCLPILLARINQLTYSTTVKHLSVFDIGNSYIPMPELSIQERIADYLDNKCACIDAVIEQTRASIEEYKKLKQAVITQAVTKGIRPNRPMKDSGIDWIGKVPCDWKVTKLKYFATIRSGITLGKVYPAGTKLVEYPYLRVANVQGSYTDLRDVATIAVTEEEAEKYRLHDGELLMTEGGDRDKLGRGTVWHAEIDPCLHQNHVFALRTNEKLLAEYVSYLSESLVGRDYFDVTANQSVHLASTNSTTILNFAIPYPLMDEQKAIVEYLKRKTMEIDIIMEKKQRLLFNVEAYKKSVIYEHVTGKKGDGSIEKAY